MEGEIGEGGGGLSGEVMRPSTDLHRRTSLECLRHEPFLMIFSSAGTKMLLMTRDSASEEAIPRVSPDRSGGDMVNYGGSVEVGRW